MVAEIAEVCLIANLQTLGPVYITDTSKGIFDQNSGMLLAARIIITSGMGNQASSLHKLHGPVPIPELQLESDYLCYFYIDHMKQQPNPETPYATGKGTYIICIVIPEEEKNEFRPYEKQMEEIILSEGAGIAFDDTKSGEISEELKQSISARLEKIYTEIMDSFSLSPLFEATSLFNVGLLASLPDHIGKFAKKLILNPKGLPEQDIEDDKVLKTLINADLVTREQRGEGFWLVPR